MSRLLTRFKDFIGKVETKEEIPKINNVSSKNEKYIQQSSITRYGFGTRTKQLTIKELEKIQKAENEKNRQEMVDEIMKLKEQINPETGKKYTYRDLAIIFNCSRTAIGDIINGKSKGKSVARRISKA